MPRPKKPHIVKRLIRGKVRYVADLGKIEGKRVAPIFKVRQEAEDFLAEKKTALAKHGYTSVALSEDERVTFQAARDRLARANATITQAVEFYLAHHKPLKEPITLATLLSRFCLNKELVGGDKRSLQSFTSSCNSFMRGRESRMAHTITRDEIKDWILGNGFAPKTQRNYLGDMRTLLGWAKQEKYAWSNPIEGDDGWIELAPMPDAEITAFDLSSCRALLKTALLAPRKTRQGFSAIDEPFGHRPMIGYLALALFCGVRPAEVRRTTIREMDLRERAVIIEGARSKTRKRRVIELPRVAAIWLRLWVRLCPEVTGFHITNFDRRWEALRKDAGIEHWPHDILRHTCATYTYAAEQNLAKLQALLGHSEDEDTLFKHYRAVRTIAGKMINKRMGEEFFWMTPRRVRLW